ncbi:FMN-binding protein [Hutsoniella sourekii]
MTDVNKIYHYGEQRQAVDTTSSASQSSETHPDQDYPRNDNQFIGQARGLNGEVVARVTLSIDQIEIIDEKETTGIGDLATRTLPERMLQEHKIDVDSITGATVTSQAVKKAVQEAMQAAVDDWSRGLDPVHPASSLPAQTAGPGQYIGQAQGLGGTLEVQVSSSDGQTIEAVQVLNHNETPGIGTKAIDALPDLFVQENSTQVDAIAGATITSQALKEAVQNALAQGASTPASAEGLEGVVAQLLDSKAFQGAIYDVLSQYFPQSSQAPASANHTEALDTHSSASYVSEEEILDEQVPDTTSSASKH